MAELGPSPFIIDATANYEIPASVIWLQVECWGGGGAGYPGSAGVDQSGGAAGGGGGYSRHSLVRVTPGNTYTFTVGLGGGVFSNGGDSEFTGNIDIVRAKGGQTAPSQFQYGLGGYGSGEIVYRGGNGGDSRGSPYRAGGGGGESGCTDKNGQAGQIGGQFIGGNGGDGGDGGNGGKGGDAGAHGNVGVVPGGAGGGGGSRVFPLAGETNGAHGRIKVTYTTLNNLFCVLEEFNY